MEKRKILQISMDGPNVNWLLYESIVEEWNENYDYPDLIDIGSWSLHVVHGAFRAGVQKTEWGSDSILQALYNLFPNSPQKGKTMLRLQDLKCFHYFSVEPDR